MRLGGYHCDGNITFMTTKSFVTRDFLDRLAGIRVSVEKTVSKIDNHSVGPVQSSSNFSKQQPPDRWFYAFRLQGIRYGFQSAECALNQQT